MLLPSRIKVSRSFTPLLTTSTSFVATHRARSAAVNRLFRTVVEEDGLATTKAETVGVTHSRPGRRYCCPELLAHAYQNTYNNPRLTRLIPTPTSLTTNVISCSAVNSSSGPNNPPLATSIQSSGPALLLPLKCFGVGLEETPRLPWRGCTTTRTGSLRGGFRRSPCNLSGARCDRASVTLRLE